MLAVHLVKALELQEVHTEEQDLPLCIHRAIYVDRSVFGLRLSLQCFCSCSIRQIMLAHRMALSCTHAKAMNTVYRRPR